ncbi:MULTISPECIES: acetyltransferase [Bordetella]|uniref:Acetyltransferase n=6 Tax=Bordetella TaxID=517 RepID=A0A0T7CKP6_BORP1|nr:MULTISPECIES: acetyltransferase [Bordetella]KAK63600.1 putative N-acetyltransferase YjaB [Bordetella bronchiseptica 980-2]KDD49041.1 putative N-acetyltransferase YjaB [Bordetella bronchiseptica OSU553]SHP82653.1 putative acetyltransferase [Mycobacteroides abscessus subsp. abscessus]AMG86591.1 acetyltransferase [Bordetella bronchiseptica]AUL17773.1 acetyltransferase [Bordetella bronchiseptica]
MNIRERNYGDDFVLADIWLRSVRATHTFLSEAQIQAMYPQVLKSYLPSVRVWVCEDGQGGIAGFMGMSGNKIEMLFVDADKRGRGAGRRLLNFARSLHDSLRVDVNEQNAQAVGFYLHSGFVETGRSDTDDAGRPFPIIHMRLDG